MSKKEQKENILETPSIENSEKKALSSEYFIEGEWPSKNWWEIYNSKELNSLVAEALKNNYSIEAVHSKIDYAKNEAIIKRSKLFPLIFFNGVDEWQYLSKNGLYRLLNPRVGLSNQTVNFHLSFDYEIDFWSKYRNLYRSSLSEAKAAIAEAAQVELMTATAIAQVYFGIRVNMIRKDIFVKLYEARKEYFKLQKAMLKNSLYSALVPLLSEEQVFASEQLVFDIEKEIENGIHLINVLCGKSPDAEIEFSEKLDVLSDNLAIPSKISLEFLSRRPDFMAQLFKMESLAYSVGAAKADFYPNVNLAGFLGFDSGSWSDFFRWASKTVGVVPTLKMPVYTAGAVGANVKGKKALYNQAVFEYNELILKGFQEVTDLLSVGRAIYAEQNAQDSIIKNSEMRLKLTQIKNTNGLDSYLEIYQRLEDLYERQLKRAELLYEQYAVSVQLVRSLGGGYVADQGESDDPS